MKINRRLAAAALALLSAPALALPQPLKINFQGKLINPSTNNPQAGPATLTFKIWNDPTATGASNLLYTETQSNVPLVNGVFSVQVGTSAALPRDLFLGASVYLGVTVSGDPGGEMAPRQQLIMTPYAFTANQLSDAGSVRLVADMTYSTFTSDGNLAVPAGIVASSGSFTNGVTAASGTFSGAVTASSATFGVLSNTAYGLTVSSGLVVQNGTLDVNGSGGINAIGTGIAASTLTLYGVAAPPVSPAGTASFYVDATTKKLMLSQNAGSWDVVLDTRTETQWIPTMMHPQATGAAAMDGTANQVKCVRFYETENFLVERMAFEVVTAGTGVGDVGIYNDSTKALIVHTGGLTIASTGVKSTTGLSGFLQKQTMYRYCFCASGTTGTVRTTNATDVTNNLENAFLASPAEGTSGTGCTTGVLPATLGTMTSASVIPVLAVIANTAGP